MKLSPCLQAWSSFLKFSKSFATSGFKPIFSRMVAVATCVAKVATATRDEISACTTPIWPQATSSPRPRHSARTP
eukprot:12885313-Prorocentrum_lima.AAC.1